MVFDMRLIATRLSGHAGRTEPSHMIKSALKFKFLRSILGYISGLYLTLLGRTIRWHRLDGDGLSGQLELDGSGILVLWHSRLISIPHLIGREYRPNVLVSKSRELHHLQLM